MGTKTAFSCLSLPIKMERHGTTTLVNLFGLVWGISNDLIAEHYRRLADGNPPKHDGKGKPYSYLEHAPEPEPAKPVYGTSPRSKSASELPEARDL